MLKQMFVVALLLCTTNSSNKRGPEIKLKRKSNVVTTKYVCGKAKGKRAAVHIIIL